MLVGVEDLPIRVGELLASFVLHCGQTHARRVLDERAFFVVRNEVDKELPLRKRVRFDDWIFPGEILVERCENVDKVCKASKRATRVVAGWKSRGVETKQSALNACFQLQSRDNLKHCGRLDKNTTGLLLFLNDGELDKLLLRPGNVPKTYVATCRASASELTDVEAKCARLVEGIELADGAVKFDAAALVHRREFCPEYALRRIIINRMVRQKKLSRQAAEKIELGDVYVVPTGEKRRRISDDIDWEAERTESDEKVLQQLREKRRTEVTVRVSLRVGRYRVVRRSLAAVGLPVYELHRTRFASVRLGSLKNTEGDQLREGESVELAESQVAELWKIAGGREAVKKMRIENLNSILHHANTALCNSCSGSESTSSGVIVSVSSANIEYLVTETTRRRLQAFLDSEC